MKNLLIVLFITLQANAIYGQDPKWHAGLEFPSSDGKFSDIDRSNIYNLEADKLESFVFDGNGYAATYPIPVTGLLLPYKVFIKSFEWNESSSLKSKFFIFFQNYTDLKRPEDFYNWLGLNQYDDESVFNKKIPATKEYLSDLPFGASLLKVNGIENLTFGCMACHSSNLFGKTIMGLTNRFPKANDLFKYVKDLSKLMLDNSEFGGRILNLDSRVQKSLTHTFKNLRWAQAEKPLHPSLDTSLAQVGNSLYYRAKDEYASKVYSLIFKKPALSYIPADSKPAVWWNIKYKNKWLSDGSIISGNPVLTNILWNEIGRGADLNVLQNWVKENPQIIKKLTAAVFYNKAPFYTDFFRATDIDLLKAKRGEKIFKKNCQKCHGVYEKNWSLKNAEKLFSDIEILKTHKVKYKKQTKAINVGTDPYRREGMKYFYKDLNRLKFSKKFGVKVEVSKGYVPPPLVGIWSRWPYFHNNSAPSLCAVLTPAIDRPKAFWTGKAIDKEVDFDQKCNGYPLGEKVPSDWKLAPEYYFDTSRVGMGNMGHDKKILLTKEGKRKFTETQKFELIEFLKTL